MRTGVRGQSPIPNPQSPIPNPQSKTQNPQSPIQNPKSKIPSPRPPVLSFTMDAQGTLSPEDRLAEFFVLPLFARESAWAEIADDLIEYDPAPPSSPAPVTLRFRARR